MSDELRHEELLLQRARDNALGRAAEIEQQLRSPRFGWTRDPPPKSGIIEVAQGFSVTYADFLGDTHHSTILPGLVDVAVYTLPDGILWRPKP